MEEEDFTLDVIGDIYTSHARKRLKERGNRGEKVRASDRENIIVTVLPPPIKKNIYKKKTTIEEIRAFYEANNTMIFCNGECKRKLIHFGQSRDGMPGLHTCKPYDELIYVLRSNCTSVC